MIVVLSTAAGRLNCLGVYLKAMTHLLNRKRLSKTSMMRRSLLSNLSTNALLNLDSPEKCGQFETYANDVDGTRGFDYIQLRWQSLRYEKP